MKLFVAIFLSLLIKVATSQDFPELDRLIQIADSIRGNAVFFGPHLDYFNTDTTDTELLGTSVTYYRINDLNYTKETDVIFSNYKSSSHYSWYVFKGEPIIFSKQEFENRVLKFNITFFISNREIIGLSFIGDLNGEEINEIEKELKDKIQNKNWL